MALEFTVDHDHTYAGGEGEEQLIGNISFTVQTRPGDFRVRNSGAPTPRTINLPRRTAWLGVDGHLYKDSSAAEPFRLVANDPAFNLEHITYRADFELTTLVGVPVKVPHTYFPAPSTDTTLQLTKVMNDLDQPVMEVRTKGYAEDILDISEPGLVMVTGTAADMRSALGVNLVDLNDITWFDEAADFPAEGVNDVVYGDRSDGKLYLWDGADYIAARAAVSSADVVDSTATGRSLITAADAAAARTAIDALAARTVPPTNGVDDRAAIQAILNEGPGIVVFPSGGTWIVDPTGQPSGNALKPQSNTLIIVERGATVQVKANALAGYALFCLDGVENVTIEGAGTLLGDSPTHTGSTGANGHLILITNGSSDCQVLGPLLLKQAWGDGVYIGGTAICHNIVVDGLVIEDCRRQGVGPYWVDGCVVRNCRIFDIGLTDIDYTLCNAAAIDVEPNAAQVVNNVLIENNDVSNCRGSGITVLGHFGTVTGITVRGNRIDGCGYDSSVVIAGVPHGLIVKNVADAPQVVDNTVTNSGYSGGTAVANLDVRLCDGAVVRGGYYAGASGPGIYVDTCTFASLDGATVHDNTHYGVLLNGSDDTLITGCNLLDNCQDGAAGTAHLHIFNGDRTAARGNTFRGSLAAAWVITQDATVVDSIFVNNVGVGTAPTNKASDAGTNTVFVGNVRKGTGVYESWTTADRVTAGTVELGHATDTTIARSAAGRVTVEGAEVITATAAAAVSAKATPVDADTFVMFDSEAAGVPKRWTWANIKTALQAWLGLLPSGTVVAIHNQADQTTNFERLRAFFSSNIAQLMTEQGGTGSFRDLRVGVANTHYAAFSISNPKVLFFAAASGTAGALMQASQGGLTGASVAQTGFRFAPTVNQTGTSSYIGVEVDVTETGTGSGTKKLLSLKVGGTEKFAVDNTGAIITGGGIVRVYNVKDATYGALGNNSANDTTAIQNAINAASAAGGGIVFFPPGIYRHTGLVLPTGGGVSLVGANRLACTLRNTHATNHSITMHSSSSGVTFVSDCNVRELTIDATAVNATQRAISVDSAILWAVQQVSLKGHGYGIYHKLSWAGSYRDVYVENCTTGFYATSSGVVSTPVLLTNVNLYNCGNGLHISNGAVGWQMIGGTIANSTGIGALFDNAGDAAFSFYGTVFESNVGDDAQIGGAAGGPQSVLFSNCTFLAHANKSRSVWYRYGDSLKFDSCRWYNTGGTTTTGIEQDPIAGNGKRLVVDNAFFQSVTNHLTKWDGSYTLTTRADGTYVETGFISHGLEGGIQRAGNISPLVSSAVETLKVGAPVYVLTGTTARTWTMPPIAGFTGETVRVKNRSNQTLTLASASGSQIYDTAAQASISVTAGTSALLVNDGTYWVKM